MKITKITLYMVPYTFSSDNRFIDPSVLENYEKFEIDDPKKFAWNMKNGYLNATLNVNTKQGTEGYVQEGYTYAKIESDLFGTVGPVSYPVSYWFLQSINSLNSIYATTYNVRLDVIASFGRDLFNGLEGQNVLVNRMHENRWVANSDGTYSINTNSHFLTNGEFNVPDTKGMEIKYSGGNALIWASDDYNSNTPLKRTDMKIAPENGQPGISNEFRQVYWSERDNKRTIVKNLQIVEYTQSEKQTWYIYAILNNLGDPVIEQRNEYIYDQYTLALVQPHVGMVDTTKYNDNDISKLHAFENLQEGKLVNMLISPFPIDNPDVESGANPTSYNDIGKLLYDEKGTWVGQDKAKAKYGIYISRNWFRDMITSASLGHDLHHHYFSCRVEPLDIKNFGFKEGNAHAIKTSLDPVLLNPSISPITIKYKDNEIMLDVYNYLKNPIIDSAPYYNGKNNLQVLMGTFNVSPQSVHFNLNISKNQFMEVNDVSYYDYNNSAGATYLTQNKNSIDGQKKLIDLQKAKEQLDMSKEYGSSVSFWDPVSWFNGAKDAGLQVGAQYEASQIKDQEKANIDNSIKDAYAAAPNVHLGNDNDSIHRMINYNNLKYKFNYIMKMPNKFILNRILTHLNKYGYKIDDYLTFHKEDMLNSRLNFNYIQIADVKNSLMLNLSQTSGVPDHKHFAYAYPDIIDEFANILAQGVRIWHGVISFIGPDNNKEKMFPI